MTIKLQVVLVICVIIFLAMIIRLLRKKSLELKYSILWIITGVVLLVLAIFPTLLEKFTAIVGIYSVVNGLFAIALFFTLLMLLSLSSIVSQLTKKNKEIAQQLALIEKEIKKTLEKTDD